MDLTVNHMCADQQSSVLLIKCLSDHSIYPLDFYQLTIFPLLCLKYYFQL